MATRAKTSIQCPRPEKRKFPSYHKALNAALKNPRPVSIYLCKCGNYHHTTRKSNYTRFGRD